MNRDRTALVALTLLMVWPGMAAAAPGNAGGAEDDAQKVFDSLYGERMRRVQATRDRDDDVALAKELYEAASSVGVGAPELVALLCDKVYELGATHPSGYDTAIAAMKLLARKDPAKAASAREKALDLLQRRYLQARSNERDAAGGPLIAALAESAEAHADNDEFDEAANDYRRALSVARAIKSDRLEALAAGLDGLKHQQKVEQTIRQLKQKLEAQPDDAASADRLVTAYVVDLDQPAKAKLFLTLLKNDELKTNTLLALKPVPALPADEALTLAAWYRKASNECDAGAKPAMLNRARAYYERFLQLHTQQDVQRVASELVLKDMKQQMAKLGVTPYPPRTEAPGPANTPASPPTPPATALSPNTPPTPAPANPAPPAGDPSAVTLAPRATLAGHLAAVKAVAFSPDGRRLATGGDAPGNLVGFWDATTGQKVAMLGGHTNGVTAVAFSPDGKTLAAGGGDGSIRLWETATRRTLRVITAPAGINDLAWSRNGGALATACDNNRVQLWDPQTGEQRGEIRKHTQRVNALAFSPDGKLLATASDDTLVVLWDAVTHRELLTLVNKPHRVVRLAFSPDSKTLALGADTNRILLFDLTTRRVRDTIKAFNGSPSSLTFSPDGSMLASAASDRSIALWSAADGEPLTKMISNTGAMAALAFSPDGNTLVTAGLDSKVMVWDVRRGGAGAASQPAGPPAAAVAAGQQMDLLELVDPQQDASAGRWTKTQEGLRSARMINRIALPVDIDGDYDLELRFTREEGEDSINVFLPVGQSDVGLIVCGFQSNISGLDLIDGQRADTNVTRTQKLKMQTGQAYRLNVRVRTNGAEATIEADVDGESLLRWHGAQSSLRRGPFAGLRGGAHLGVGSWYSTVLFQSATLRMRSGKATPRHGAVAVARAPATPGPASPFSRPGPPTRFPTPRPPSPFPRTGSATPTNPGGASATNASPNPPAGAAPAPPIVGADRAPDAKVVIDELVRDDAELVGVQKLELVERYDAAKLAIVNDGARGGIALIGGAQAGAVWVGKPGVNDFTVTGPKSNLPAGQYLVVYRLMLRQPANGKAAPLDVSATGGQLANRSIAADKLPVNQWRCVGAPAQATRDLTGVEFRVWQHGQSVAVDRIYVFHVYATAGAAANAPTGKGPTFFGIPIE
jgi:tetratricopeptide (TPR) repeat protein